MVVFEAPRLVMFLLIFFFLIANGIQLSGATREVDPSSIYRGGARIFLDVDNTLYSEQEYGIERQIVQCIHLFCMQHLNMTSQEADELHHQYGSTVEGLRSTAWKNMRKHRLEKSMRLYYDQVYSSVRVESLLGPRSKKGTPSSTGYTHQNSQEIDLIGASANTRQDRKIDWMRRFVRTCPHEILLASNSPLLHVKKVIQAMGLCRVFESPSSQYDIILTPDSSRHANRGWFGNSKNVVFPTKRHPLAFFGSTVQQQQESRKIVLVDDSKKAIESCQSIMDGILVNGENSVEAALCQAMGWLDPLYTFSQVHYLKSKNQVDEAAIDRATWRRLGSEMHQLVRNSQSVQIVDLGAGLLSMLRWILFGGSQDVDALPSLLDLALSNDGDYAEQSTTRLNPREIHYTAYEPNMDLRDACIEQLFEMGFSHFGHEDNSRHAQLSFQKITQKNSNSSKLNVFVHLRFCDYRLHHPNEPTPHLIVGCCFADLMDPKELSASLVQTFLAPLTDVSFNHTLFYFPITFEGITQFLPPRPFEMPESLLSEKKAIPSDTTAFAVYSSTLNDDHGHNMDPRLLEEALGSFGGTKLARGRSSWIISPEKHSYLWETMLYFFGTVMGLELQESRWDVEGWFQRARRHRPTIRASNVDMLWRIPHIGSWNVPNHSTSISPSPTFNEIQFCSPGNVTFLTKESPSLAPSQVRIESVASLVSTGTELKIFRGNFDDAALDVNIKGMEEERMAYPLAYGYSLVGRITQCGDQVQDAENLLGKLVFVFAPHGSQVVMDQSAIHIVPDGIDPYDAIFFPSVETALSLVQDANPRIGESVIVFGQGLIGLLVTAVLSQQCLRSAPGQFGTVTTVDTIPERLAASAAVGASQALFPNEVPRDQSFDVAIEVSGNGRALQAAIDSIRNGGKVIVGSWYGTTEIPLTLGIDFHRSQKELKASQVSVLPAEMSGTWSKERRFSLTWDLLREIRPSRLITRIASLDQSQEVYEDLEKGNDIASAFDYKGKSR